MSRKHVSLPANIKLPYKVQGKTDQLSLKQTVKVVTNRELLGLVSDVEELRKSNEQLLRKQQRQFGVTLDRAEMLKHDIERAKTMNKNLLDELESGKGKCDRLKVSLQALHTTFKQYQTTLRDYETEQRTSQTLEERLEAADQKCRKLGEANKRLKNLLLKNRIDPRIHWIEVEEEVKELNTDTNSTNGRRVRFKQKVQAKAPLSKWN